MSVKGKQQKADVPVGSRLKNLAVWFVCLIAAFALWNSLKTEEKTDSQDAIKSYSVPVTLLNRDKLKLNGFWLMGGTDATLKVTLSGLEKNLPKSDGTDVLKASVDLSTVTADTPISENNTIRLPVEVQAPDGCEVYSLSEDTVEVEIQKNRTKWLALPSGLDDLVPEWEGLPQFCSVKIEKREFPSDLNGVTVSGPDEEVEAVSKMKIVFETTGEEQSVECEGAVVLLDKDDNELSLTFAEIEPPTVTAVLTTSVVKELEKEVSVSFRQGFLSDGNASVECRPKTVAVKGSPDAVDKANPSVTLDEQEIFADGYFESIDRKCKVDAQEGLAFEPSEVLVTINTKGTLTAKDFTVSGADIIDQTPDTVRDAHPYTVDRSRDYTVTLLGDPEDMEKLSNETIAVSFDLSKVTEEGWKEETLTADLHALPLSTAADSVMTVGGDKIQVNLGYGS